MSKPDESHTVPPALQEGARVRVMLRVNAEFTAPAFVLNVAFWPHDLCTVDVASNALDALRAHPGVLAVSLPHESRTVRPPLGNVLGEMPDVSREDLNRSND
jgi:hypothetical protein